MINLSKENTVQKQIHVKAYGETEIKNVLTKHLSEGYTYAGQVVMNNSGYCFIIFNKPEPVKNNNDGYDYSQLLQNLRNDLDDDEEDDFDDDDEDYFSHLDH